MVLNALLDVLAKKGEWEQAIRVIGDDLIPNPAIQADNNTVSAFVQCFMTAGEYQQAKVAQQLGSWLTATE